MPESEMRPEARWILDNFDDCLAGLLHYGSTAFGQARRGSACDFWVIVTDLREFHSRFEPMPCKLSKGPDSVEKRAAFNRGAPNFYAIERDGMRMKLAVVDVETFCGMRDAPTYYITGRMQKPLNIIKAEPRVMEAIRAAREEAVQWALDLMPSRFTFDEFLETALGLSYRTEIRPEFKKRKVRSIIETGRGMITGIYRPLLDGHPNIVREGDIYIDTRDDETRRLARVQARKKLRRLKWSWGSFRQLYQNYKTHYQPLRYLWRKVVGEIEKLFKTIFGAKTKT